MAVLEDVQEEEEDFRQAPRWRRAWCELTGGHKSTMLPAGTERRTFAVRLHCQRCGYLSRWWSVPSIGKRTDADWYRDDAGREMLERAVEAADALRQAQRTYLADRTEANGAAVGEAARAYDALRERIGGRDER